MGWESERRGRQRNVSEQWRALVDWSGSRALLVTLAALYLPGLCWVEWMCMFLSKPHYLLLVSIPVGSSGVGQFATILFYPKSSHPHIFDLSEDQRYFMWEWWVSDRLLPLPFPRGAQLCPGPVTPTQRERQEYTHPHKSMHTQLHVHLLTPPQLNWSGTWLRSRVRLYVRHHLCLPHLYNDSGSHHMYIINTQMHQWYVNTPCIGKIFSVVTIRNTYRQKKINIPLYFPTQMWCLDAFCGHY